MGKRVNHYLRALECLERLGKKHPTYTMGRHIATAFSDYGDLWGISGKEFQYALEKYEAELEMDHTRSTPEDELSKIIEEGKNLDKISFDSYEEE